MLVNHVVQDHKVELARTGSTMEATANNHANVSVTLPATPFPQDDDPVQWRFSNVMRGQGVRKLALGKKSLQDVFDASSEDELSRGVQRILCDIIFTIFST